MGSGWAARQNNAPVRWNDARPFTFFFRSEHPRPCFVRGKEGKGGVMDQGGHPGGACYTTEVRQTAKKLQVKKLNYEFTTKNEEYIYKKKETYDRLQKFLPEIIEFWPGYPPEPYWSRLRAGAHSRARGKCQGCQMVLRLESGARASQETT